MLFKKILHKVKAILVSVEVRLLKTRADQYGFEITEKEKVDASNTVIENYFKTNHKKNSLLSYIIYPFIGQLNNSHSNLQECFTIAKILNDLGFNVDIINWDNTTYIPNKDYALIIDNHNNLKRLNNLIRPYTIKIFHATNTYYLYQNFIEYKRHYEYFLETGYAVNPTRTLSQGDSFKYADYITMFGNNFTELTYNVNPKKVYHIPISVTCTPEWNFKDFDKAKNNFIWLNSHGFLLKGLDIVIQAFAETPDLNLFICGNLEREQDFFESLSIDLSKFKNVKTLGWVDIQGQTFNELVSKCAWVVNTSFSEGGSGSTLNCMAKGLIPILSSSSSIEVSDDIGFYIKNNDARALKEKIVFCNRLETIEISRRSRASYLQVKDNHQPSNFEKIYKSLLIDITGQAN